MSGREEPTPTTKVSIAIPIYNVGKYIRDALDSLLAQGVNIFELIIDANASTDGTEAICLEYSALDQRVRYVRQGENLGAMANFRLSSMRHEVRSLWDAFTSRLVRQCGFIAQFQVSTVAINDTNLLDMCERGR